MWHSLALEMGCAFIGGQMIMCECTVLKSVYLRERREIIGILDGRKRNFETGKPG